MTSFLTAWLIAWLFWVGISIGSLAALLTQILTGGEWARAVQRICEAALAPLPALAVLFIPIAAGAGHLYPWTQAALFAAHHWPHKQAYLTAPLFTLRSIVYIACFYGMAALLRKGVSHPKRLASIGIISLFLIMNFAGTDWVMSITPAFYSSIFPTILLINEILSGLAFAVFCVCWDARLRPATVMTKQLHDLGNLLLAFTVFWAYVAISQLILVWSGNLPREISWYLPRWHGGWASVGIALALAQFFLPFALLLFKRSKQSASHLLVIAAIELMAGMLTVTWMVAPSVAPAPHAAVLFLLVPLLIAGLGAVWLIFFLRAWRENPLSLHA